MSSMIDLVKREDKKRKWGSGTGEYPGYYLTVGVERYWIGATKNEAAKNLERACDLWLTEKNGWNWGIESCGGVDYNGYAAWGNLDIGEEILNLSENLNGY